jgi:hypothetical protein
LYMVQGSRVEKTSLGGQRVKTRHSKMAASREVTKKEQSEIYYR